MSENCIVIINEVSKDSTHIHPLYETFSQFLQSLNTCFNIESSEIKSIEYTLTDQTKYTIEEENDYSTMKSLFTETKIPILCIYITTTEAHIAKKQNNPSQLDKRLEDLSKQLDLNFKKLKDTLLDACKEFIRKEEQSHINFYRICSKCKQNIVGRLYKCSKCPDFFLCDNCLVQNSTAAFHSHTFIIILSNESYKTQLEQMEKESK